MSEPTEADLKAAREIAHFRTPYGVSESTVLYAAKRIAQARAEGHAAGRREMREEAAAEADLLIDAYSSPSWNDAAFEISRNIRALPDHPETKDKT